MINLLAALTGVQTAAALSPDPAADPVISGARLAPTIDRIAAPYMLAAFPDPTPGSGYPSWSRIPAVVPRRGFGAVVPVDTEPGAFYRGTDFVYSDPSRGVRIRAPRGRI